MDNKSLVQKGLVMHQVARHKELKLENSKLQASFKALRLNLLWKVENIPQGTGALRDRVEDPRFPNTHFQFALKVVEDKATVSVLALNLHRLSIRIAIVRLCVNDDKQFLMLRRTSEKRANVLDFFEKEFPDGLERTCSFTFQVYLESVDRIVYNHEQYDVLMDDQLWMSSKQFYGTDFKFRLSERVFNVHKFILSARSSHFASILHNRSANEIDVAVDVEPDSLACFLQYLYTGRLNYSTAVQYKQLKALAQQYQVESLKQLCVHLSSIENMNVDLFPQIFMLTSPTPNQSALRPSPIMSEACSKPDSTEIRFQWDMEHLPERNSFVTPVPVIFCNRTVMFVSFRLTSDNKKIKPEFFIFCKRWPESGLDVQHIVVRIMPNGTRHNETVSATQTGKQFSAEKWEKVEGLDSAMNVYSFEVTDMELSLPLSALFKIDLSNSCISNYAYNLRDSSFANNMWLASVEGRLTDTEFVVEDKTFTAHKVLVAARSPVLRDKLNPEVRESFVYRIPIEETDSATFEEVLFFMYTGILRVPPDDPKLLRAAKQFQIETLKNLCEKQAMEKNSGLLDLCYFLQMTA